MSEASLTTGLCLNEGLSLFFLCAAREKANVNVSASNQRDTEQPQYASQQSVIFMCTQRETEREQASEPACP